MAILGGLIILGSTLLITVGEAAPASDVETNGT